MARYRRSRAPSWVMRPARSNTDSGTVRASARAPLRLTTTANAVARASGEDGAAGPEPPRLGDREVKRSRRLEIDDQLERVGLLDGQIRWPGTLEDLRDDPGRPAAPPLPGRGPTSPARTRA